MGNITIHRPHNECGRNSQMSIFINGIDQSFEGEVADNKSTPFDVPGGEYRVFVKFGLPSNYIDVKVNTNSFNLTAIVIPKKGKIEIERVDLV
jgi:hypothetical protein